MFSFWWLWENMKGVRSKYIWALVIAVIPPLTAIINPMIVTYVVDNFIAADSSQVLSHTAKDLLPWLIAMPVVHIIRMAGYYVSIMLTEYSSQVMLMNIRKRIFDNILGQEMSFFQRYRTGDLMTRFTGDLDMCRHCISYLLRNLINHILVFTVASIYLLTVNWRLTLIVIALMPIIVIIRRVYSKIVRPIYTEVREKLSNLNETVQENIEGNRVVKAFAREDYEIAKFQEKNENYKDIHIVANRAWQRVWPLLEMISQSLNVTIALAGGLFAIAGQISVGQLASFLTLSWALSDPMRNLGALFNDLERFFTSSVKVIELYYDKPTVATRPEVSATKKDIKGDIEFRNVEFAYGKEAVLKDINLKINAGETIAIMGETGSGKTSLINLIPRLYDVKKGSVLVDGKDVRDYPLNELRKYIGFATQEVFLFSDTVDGNIAYGDLSLEESKVIQYAKMADADAFIRKTPQGYDTIIGERGVGLSGGQRQRIALARALAVNPSILILDDTTSAVDMETEMYIQEQLKKYGGGCTKLIVAQRISSVKDADKIIVLKDKTIAQMGTHEELIKQEGYYRDIYQMQADTAEELEVM